MRTSAASIWAKASVFPDKSEAYRPVDPVNTDPPKPAGLYLCDTHKPHAENLPIGELLRCCVSRALTSHVVLSPNTLNAYAFRHPPHRSVESLFDDMDFHNLTTGFLRPVVVTLRNG